MVVARPDHRYPAAVIEGRPKVAALTNNRLVLITSINGDKNAFENKLSLLGISQKTVANGPLSQGKVGRFQQR